MIFDGTAILLTESVEVKTRALDGAEWSALNSAQFDVDVPAAVIGRHVFYNNSAYDATDDDDAIATDKVALLPGETATFANYTSYARGINGLMVDVTDLSGTPTAAEQSKARSA